MPKAKKTNDTPLDVKPSNELAGEDVILDGNKLYIRRVADDEHGGYKVIDLSTCWLPVASFTLRPTPLASRQEFVSIIVTATKLLARRISRGKSFEAILSRVPNLIPKMIEYGWLNGCYGLQDWTNDLTDRLANDLATGGWAKALRLTERAESFAANVSQERAAGLISGFDKRIGWSLSASVNEALGTNAGRRELRVVLPYLAHRAKLFEHANGIEFQSIKRVPSSGMSASQLVLELDSVNLLSDLPIDMGLSFVPYPSCASLASKLGRARRRTGNLGPDDVAKLLSECKLWVESLATSVVGLLQDVYNSYKEQRPLDASETSRCAAVAIEASQHRGPLEQALKTSIGGLAKSRSGIARLTLPDLLNALFTACFLTIVFFNARRKDEVLHSTIGLQCGSMRQVDEDLQLYECSFYIEKTFRERIPYYINNSTRHAIEVLASINNLAVLFRTLARGKSKGGDGKSGSLFQFPQLSTPGSKSKLSWFKYSASRLGNSRNFVLRALGDRPLNLGAHVGRRAYALIYHYRFENSTLLGLKFQLGHFDLSAVIYITDESSRHTKASGHELFARLTPKQRKAVAEDVAGLLEEIRNVGKERLANFVEAILIDEERAVGGFTRLILKLHQQLGRRIEYSLLPVAGKVERITTSLTNRGHNCRPFSHGNCCASETAPNRAAKCLDKETASLSRENASPSTCGPCAYHHVNNQHVKNLKHRALGLEGSAATAGTATVAGLADQTKLRNLRRIILLYEERMN